MRSPSFLGVTLIALSAVALLLPPSSLCLQLLGITFPSSRTMMTSPMSSLPPVTTGVNASNSIALSLITSLIPSFREHHSSFYCDFHADGSSFSETTQMIARILLRTADTISLMISRTPQLIAWGSLFYIAACVGYVGLVHLRLSWNATENRHCDF